MNPHYLFLAIAVTSVVITATSLVENENLDGLYNMALMLGITGACVGVVMYATKKYWRDARRLA